MDCPLLITNQLGYLDKCNDCDMRVRSEAPYDAPSEKERGLHAHLEASSPVGQNVDAIRLFETCIPPFG